MNRSFLICSLIATVTTAGLPASAQVALDTPPTKPGALAGSGQSFEQETLDMACLIETTGGMSYLAGTCGPVYTEWPTEGTTCCDLGEYDADIGDCVLSCTCEYLDEDVEPIIDAEYEYLLRGVPVLFQFDRKLGNQAANPIGCGPVAVTSLMLWYHSLGWVDLAAPYENVSGKIDWETMTGDVAAYLNTLFFKNNGATRPVDMLPGMTDFLAASGYTANVTHYDFGEANADSRFEHVKSSILQGRPVILGYDSDLADGGLGSAWNDDWGYIDHYGVIVGFDDTTDPPRIFVNKGHGASSDGTREDSVYDWVIGNGNVHLWFVELLSAEKSFGDERCPGDDLDAFFDRLEIDGEYVGATELDTPYAGYPVQTSFIAGESCDLIGGIVSHDEEVVVERTEVVECSDLYSFYDQDLGTGGLVLTP